MILLAEAILKGALLRNESRGAHYKPAFPDRDDANFLKATIATYDPAADAADHQLRAGGHEPGDPPRRTYGKVTEAKAEKPPAASPAPVPVGV